MGCEMETNSETPKPEAWPNHGPTYRDWIDYVLVNSSHATQILNPSGWSEWDAGRYARQQYEEMRAELAALRAELSDANYWRERHCNESEARGKQAVEFWEQNKALRSEVERLRKQAKKTTKKGNVRK